MIFCYYSINTFFRNAYPCIWTEYGKIHFNILLKFADKWARRNLKLWYIVRSYPISASAYTLKLHFVKKQNSSYEAEKFVCYLHLYDDIFFSQIPLRHTQKPVYTTNSKKNKGGLPEDTEQFQAFEKTCTYFELHVDEQLTLSELVDILQKNLESSDKSAYTRFILSRNFLKIMVMN